jgi:hypothetical protein
MTYTFFKIGLVVLLLSTHSCSDSKNNSDETPVFESKLIAKKWTLASDPNKKTPASLVIMSIHENGYFQVYDSIIDPKFINAGINKIQFISRGQYNFDGKKLILNHFDDNGKNNKESFKVPTLTDEKLILIDLNKISHTYSTHKK